MTYPTEFVKTTLQLSGSGNRVSMLTCVRDTIRTHGVFGLYRGMAPLLIGSIPKQGTRWGAFEAATVQAAAFKSWRSDGVSGARASQLPLAPHEIALCGTFAGCAEALVAVVPMETVKTLLIADQRSAAPKCVGLSLVGATRVLIAEHGVKGALYRGAGPTVVKQALNQSIRFPVQQFVMDYAFGARRSENKARRKSPVLNGAAGFVAGIVSVAATQPADVVKTVIQQGWRPRGVAESPQLSFLSLRCVLHIARCEGFMAFYKGSVPRMVRVGANVGLTFTVFPLVRQLF